MPVGSQRKLQLSKPLKCAMSFSQAAKKANHLLSEWRWLGKGSGRAAGCTERKTTFSRGEDCRGGPVELLTGKVGGMRGG